MYQNASFLDQLDQHNSSPDAGFSARKAPENVWRPGSDRTRWGSLSAPPDPLAAKRGRGKGKEGKGRKGKGTEGEGKGRTKGGKGRGGEGKIGRGREGRGRKGRGREGG